MDWKEYIDSGMLELYVSGSLPEEDMVRIRDLELQHPELAQKIDEVQHAMVQYSESMVTEEAMPLIPSFESEVRKPAKKEDAKVVSLTSAKRWTVAASIVALITASFAVVQTVRLKTIQSELALAKSEVQFAAVKYEEKLARESELRLELENTRTEFMDIAANLSDPNTQKIVLKGQPVVPDAEALVYWNTKTQRTYINPYALPELDEAHQYQLWVLVDGKPLDAGLLNNNDNSLQPTKNIAAADAFAITVEPMGGSQTPTLEKLYVIGEVTASI